ncbi:MAG: YbaN family protein [Alphaproteobacteria bacterium]|jgi:hypothetical protein|nr:YbaN family protein [Alphaproteobacteria bacterium]
MSEPSTVSCPAATRRSGRAALLVCGWCNVALGMVGAVVPGMPTTVFLLIALWAFSKSSPRFYDWLYGHPRFGPSLRDWRDHRAVSVRAKCSAIVVMALSLSVTQTLTQSWPTTAVLGLVLASVGAWIVTRPSRPLSG